MQVNEPDGGSEDDPSGNNDINKKDDDEFFIAVTIGCNGRTTTGWPNIDDEETSGCARR